MAPNSKLMRDFMNRLLLLSRAMRSSWLPQRAKSMRLLRGRKSAQNSAAWLSMLGMFSSLICLVKAAQLRMSPISPSRM